MPSNPPVSNTALRMLPSFTGNSISRTLVSRARRQSALWSSMNIAVASSVSGRLADIRFGVPPSAITVTWQRR